MIAIKINNENKVIYQHFKTELIDTDGMIMVDTIPQPEDKDGYYAELYYTVDKGFWYEYLPLPTEVDDRPTVADLKDQKIAEIEAYYNSDDINLVSVQGIDIYLDPDTRFKLSERLKSANALGKSSINIEFAGNTFSMTTSEADYMLNAIVDQYGLAYDVKSAKIKEVRALTTEEEINSYDIKAGYPDKLML